VSSAPPAPSGPFARASARAQQVVADSRRRWGWLDHLARAGGRYQRTQGDLMAAGVTYFAFLGVFPVLLLAASIIGLVLAGDALLQRQLFEAIRDAFPGTVGRELVRQLDGAIEGAGFIGLVAVAGFLYAGLRTMDNLRIGMERIWKGYVDEPDVLRDNLQDLVALVALGAIGVASLGLTGGVTQATSWVLDLLGMSDEPGYGLLTWVLGIGLALVADTCVYLWLLRVVPSVSHPLRVLLPGALFGATGLEVLKLVGGFYLNLISDSVTASAFGGAVGLLVWINLVARFSFFTAAWTATSRGVLAADRAQRDPAPTGPPPRTTAASPGAGPAAPRPR
jgi:membrane protein